MVDSFDERLARLEVLLDADRQASGRSVDGQWTKDSGLRPLNFPAISTRVDVVDVVDAENNIYTRATPSATGTDAQNREEEKSDSGLGIYTHPSKTASTTSTTSIAVEIADTFSGRSVHDTVHSTSTNGPPQSPSSQIEATTTNRIAALTRLDAEPTPDEAAAFRAAVLEFFAALAAEADHRVEAVIDAAYAAADAGIAGDNAAAERHRAYGLALYRGSGAAGPEWWTHRPAPSDDLLFLPPPDRPVPAGRWFKVVYRTVSGADETLYWFPDAPGGVFLDQCLRSHEPAADLRWFVEEIEPLRPMHTKG